MLPHTPPLLTFAVAPPGGRIGPNPEDFEVVEVPAYEPSGVGEHLYVFIQKRGLTTPALIRALSRAANVRERDLGYAGLKDKHAVTTQWVSLPRAARPVEQWELPPNVTVLESTRHTNKLRVGHLTANHFKIRLMGVSDDAEGGARAILTRLEALGLPNYFGPQRFGILGRNIEQAQQWLTTLETSRGRQRGRPFEQRLFPSVLQSEVFNRYLTLRAERNLSKLIPGEVVRLDGTGSHFVVDDLEKEQPRFDAGDLHLTGPMFGPKLRPAASAALNLEEEALRSLELSSETVAVLGRFAPGTRRDLLVRPSGIEISSPEPGKLEVGFTLPSGSYASELIRQLTRTPFIEDKGPERVDIEGG